MFEMLKNWITSIVVIVIFMALVDMVLPSGSLKKYARLVLGLIVIIIIITPVFKLFDRNTNIETTINQYINKYDNINTSTQKSQKNYFDPDTIKIFKENLRLQVEEAINTESSIKFNVVQVNVVEDQTSANFLDIKSIQLREEKTSTNVKNVSKIIINDKNEIKDYFWNQKVANILKNKFNVEASAIKFMR